VGGSESERERGERDEGEARSKDMLKPLRILSYTICDVFLIFFYYYYLNICARRECDVLVAISSYKCLFTSNII
jgi:hypothetical protein